MSDERDTPLDADLTPDLLADRIEAKLTKLANEELARYKGPRPARAATPLLNAATIAELLDFEETNRGHAGYKDAAIRTRFGCSMTRYYQRLNKIIDTQEALEHNPTLVHRLIDTRTKNLHDRAARSTTR